MKYKGHIQAFLLAIILIIILFVLYKMTNREFGEVFAKKREFNKKKK